MKIGKIMPAIFFATIFAGSVALLQPNNEEEAATEASVVTAVETKLDIPETRYVKYSIPDGDTSFKTYMDYRCITNTRSMQYKLQTKAWTDDEGLRRINDDYIVALGTFYAEHIGDRVKITLDTGEEFTATVGDFKANCHTDATNRYTSMTNGCKNVVEFIVDTKSMNSKPRRMGDISYCYGMKGNITSIERIYNE